MERATHRDDTHLKNGRVYQSGHYKELVDFSGPCQLLFNNNHKKKERSGDRTTSVTYGPKDGTTEGRIATLMATIVIIVIICFLENEI